MAKGKTRLYSKRYLGLELSGAKSQKTTLAAIEHYPIERKIFLLDVFEKIGKTEKKSADQFLIQTLKGAHGGSRTLGVNAPLTLPPLFSKTRSTHLDPSKSKNPSVKWMNEAVKKASRRYQQNKEKFMLPKEFTPYTQRPVELFIRYNVLPEIPKRMRFDVDETLGGTRAPIAARMNFLQPFMKNTDILEVWPRLTIASLAVNIKIPARHIGTYRHLDRGAHSRENILEAICKEFDLFIYDKDATQLTKSLQSFDAFICALTGILFNMGQCEKPPKGFPSRSGWVTYPKF